MASRKNISTKINTKLVVFSGLLCIIGIALYFDGLKGPINENGITEKKYRDRLIIGSLLILQFVAYLFFIFYMANMHSLPVF